MPEVLVEMCAEYHALVDRCRMAEASLQAVEWERDRLRKHRNEWRSYANMRCSDECDADRPADWLPWEVHDE